MHARGSCPRDGGRRGHVHGSEGHAHAVVGRTDVVAVRVGERRKQRESERCGADCLVSSLCSPQHQLIRRRSPPALSERGLDALEHVLGRRAPTCEFAPVDSEHAWIRVTIGGKNRLPRPVEGLLGRGGQDPQARKALHDVLAGEAARGREIMACDCEQILLFLGERVRPGPDPRDRVSPWCPPRSRPRHGMTKMARPSLGLST